MHCHGNWFHRSDSWVLNLQCKVKIKKKLNRFALEYSFFSDVLVGKIFNILMNIFCENFGCKLATRMPNTKKHLYIWRYQRVKSIEPWKWARRKRMKSIYMQLNNLTMNAISVNLHCWCPMLTLDIWISTIY